MPQPQKVDVLVVGGGAAGMTAALAARASGLAVLIIESTEQVGGTTSTSAGTLWLPCAGDGNGDAAGRESAREYLHACIGVGAQTRKIDAYLDSGGELLRFLHERTRVRLDAVPVHPDYLQSLPGATLGGRAFAPREFDGRTLGRRQFARVRAPLPEFMVLGGMMVSKTDIPLLLSARRDRKALLHAAKLVSRYASDRIAGHGRGTRLVMGNALVAQLFSSILDAEVGLAFRSRVSRIERARDGFTCQVGRAGAEQEVGVRKAIILATGGFSGDAGMREQWMPPAARGQSVAHTGDAGGGIRLGESLGAALETDHAQPAFWMPVSTMERADNSTAMFPHIVLDRAKPGSLVVDGRGHRFANEADSYHHFCTAMLEASQRERSHKFFLVADMAFVGRYGLGMIRPGAGVHKFVRCGYLVRGASAHELAAKLQLDSDAFESTLGRYNVNAALGEDPDFQRGESALNRHNGDPEQRPNSCLRALDLQDLCAVELKVADLATSIGLSTDEDARVLDAAGQAITGLYACGNDMASMMRGAYPGPGTTLGPGMTFAWRAVKHISGAPQRTDRVRACEGTAGADINAANCS
jgi:3-oxosteroid 1-dehydrogenase